MNLNRTDIFLLATIFFQLQLLFQLLETIGYGALTAIAENVSLVPAVTVVVFMIGVVFSLQGVKAAVTAYFAPNSEDRDRGARAAGVGLVLTGFLLVCLIFLTRTFAYSL